MKSTIVKSFAVLTIIAGFASCKDKENETEAMDAEMAAEAAETTYNVDTANSSIMWEGSKPTGTHTGTVNIMNGSLTADEDGIANGSFVINMESVNVTDLEGDSKVSLEQHLMGTVEGKETDFFNVKKYPTASFEITGMENRDGKMMMMGNLTMKDQTKNIAFPVVVDMNGDMANIKSEKFTIDRTDWGVNYGSKSVFDNLGDKFISDDMTLQISVSAKKQ